MRSITVMSLAAGAVVLALLVPMNPAGAMALPAPAALAVARNSVGVVEPVRTVCQKEWDGYEWQSHCRTVRPKNSRSAQIRRLQRRLYFYLRYW